MTLRDFRKRLEFWLATRLSWIVVLALGYTARIRLIGRDKVDEMRRQGQTLLFALWHGRLLLPMFVHRGEGICAMVSRHRDGEMIARTLHRLGYRTVRGSSSKGGREAFWEMARAMRNGADGVVIPDGPTGPRHKLKPGLLFLAQQTGAAIVPVTYSADRMVQFNSWDRFTLWLPFARCVLWYGEPRFIPRHWSRDEVLQEGERIEEEMIRLETAADAYFRK
ncbi:MAG: lysophospholipid acyltransferase family protein [candidate division KSB1 bacterium]|nr:lysophospholipid acyltransferase family protein [candidate division KSB1 bacterium]